MVSKRFYIPALVTSFLGWFLLLLCTISTPTTFHTSTPFNFVEATNLGNITDLSPRANSDRNLTGIKLGSWGYCTRGTQSSSYNYCSENGHGYNVTLRSANVSSQAAYESTEIKPSWTRGLVVVVVAFVAGFVGWVLSFVPQQTVQLVAAIVHVLAFVLALIAFAIQIALFIYTRNRLNTITDDPSVVPGPGFYLTLISLLFLAASAVLVGLGWKKEKDDGYLPSSYAGPSSTAAGGSSTFGSKFSNRLSFKKSDASAGGEKIEMNSANQTSRQRVLDAFKSDNN